MNVTAAFPCIEREIPRYLDFWKEIVRLESPSWDRAAVCAVADCIAQFAAAQGFTVDRTPQPRAGDTLRITLPGTLDAPPVALMAHMDTVHPVGSFGDPVVRAENGVLYGPGVFDCKGGIAVGLLCMDALHRCGVPHPEVRLVLDPDEENGTYIGEAGGQFIRDAVQGCMAALNLESGRDGSLTVGRKGVLRAELTVRGIAAHAGNDYFSGASAIREAAHKILELERISSPEGITVNCGLIRGGSAVNTVPEDCTVDIDVRFKNQAQQEEALAHLRRVAEAAFVPGVSASLRVLHIHPAMACTAANLHLFETVSGLARELGLEDLVPMERGGGSDSAYPVQLGIPTVCSLGPIGRYEHTLQEQADIGTLGTRAKLLTAVILHLAAANETEDPK